MKNVIRSPALKKFWINLREVGIMMPLFKTNKIVVDKTTLDESLARAALLLLCSHVENFFESLIENILEFHEFNKTPINQLPEKLKIIQLLKPSESLDMSYPGNKWKLIQKVRGSKFTDSTQKCAVGDFNLAVQVKGFASPGSEEVENLFKNIGLDNVWQIIEIKTGSDKLRLSLNSFISRRHSIAHGNAADRPTPADIQSIVVNTCNLLQHFNLIVVEYLLHNFNPARLWGYEVLMEKK
jgi:RiboL-PSP-HEPN